MMISKRFLLLIIIAAAIGAHLLFNQAAPQEKITISLPYPASTPPRAVMPMGETINHPPPDGHPGVDFQWTFQKKIDIIACADGVVSGIKKDDTADESRNKWRVYVKSGSYEIAYTELEEVDPAITKGVLVKAGQRIGEPGKFDGDHYNIHWELRTGTRRICPMSYFDPESRARIEKDWANTDWPEMKSQFPYICSGYYKE